MVGILEQNKSQGGVVQTYLLDDYPAAAAYSLRKLRSQAINAVDINNGNGDVATILLKPTGSITLNSTLDVGGTLGDWIGSGTAYVQRWHDQSGNNRHLVLESAGEEPVIVRNGALYLKNALAALDMLTVSAGKLTYPLPITALNPGLSFTVYTVSSIDIPDSVGTILCTTNNVDGYRLVMFRDSRNSVYRNSVIQSANGAFPTDLSVARNTTNPVLQIISSTGSVLKTYDNGATGTQSSYTGTYRNERLQIGAQHSNLTRLDGTIQEIIIRAGEDTTLNREFLRDNINAYYSIY